MSVKFSDLLDAFHFVSFGSPYDHEAYLDRETGQVFYASESGELDELPDDLEDEKYLEIPRENDLDLGQNLVLDFVAAALSAELEAVARMFRRKGAYGRFKSLLDAHGLLERWHDYEAKAEETALRRWCQDNDVELT